MKRVLLDRVENGHVLPVTNLSIHVGHMSRTTTRITPFALGSILVYEIRVSGMDKRQGGELSTLFKEANYTVVKQIAQ